MIRNSRELMKKKGITDYIYARLIDDKWEVTDGKSNKFDKVLIKKAIYESIPEISSDKKIVDENNVALAPDIIVLEDDEKFRDDNNNIVDIEIRGNRTADGIYFRVKDVAAGFRMGNLVTTVIDKRRGGFNENKHYKYFNNKKEDPDSTPNNKKRRSTIKKELFLTYRGFQHLIGTSRNACANNNSYIMSKWLANFDKKVLKSYRINISDNIIKNKIGYVYIVSSNLLDANKLGMWRSNIESLHSRYITYYGKNVHIDCFLTADARSLESKIHKHFKKYRITNELFDKLHYDKYVDFIGNNIDPVCHDFSESEFPPNYADEPYMNDDKIALLEQQLKQEKHKNNILQNKIVSLEKIE